MQPASHKKNAIAMLNTREHIDLMAQFEKDAKNKFYGLQFDKEPKELWPRGAIYQHGQTNLLFLAYRRGYANGKTVERFGIYESTPA